MWSREKTEFDRFVDTFLKRYRNILESDSISLDDDVQLYWLYLEFRDSGVSLEQWFEEQESS